MGPDQQWRTQRRRMATSAQRQPIRTRHHHCPSKTRKTITDAIRTRRPHARQPTVDAHVTPPKTHVATTLADVRPSHCDRSHLQLPPNTPLLSTIQTRHRHTNGQPMDSGESLDQAQNTRHPSQNTPANTSTPRHTTRNTSKGNPSPQPSRKPATRSTHRHASS